MILWLIIVLFSDESSKFLKWNKVISLKPFHSMYQILVLFFFYLEKQMDRNLQTLEGRHHWGSLPLYFAQGCMWAVQLIFGCFLVFCFAWVKGESGHNWPGQAFSSQDPCSKRIRKSSLLKPNCKLNTRCCINLKISGLIVVSKTMDANALESCQSEILFESQVAFFILLYRHEPWEVGHSELSAEMLMPFIVV